MGFHAQLNAATRDEQEALFSIPFVRAAIDGALTREQYLAFLAQAYHHVRHTVPLLLSAGAFLPDRLAWMRPAIAHYVEEESGHEEWILEDIRESGGDADRVVAAGPDLPCEVLVAYAYDVTRRGNAAGFFGMVHVLEGTSVRGATAAAAALERSLGLPAAAFTYLTTHGDLDQDHVRFFADLMDRVEDPGDRRRILHTSRVFFRLYGDVFRALEPRARTLAEVNS